MNIDDFLRSPGLYEEMYDRYNQDPKSVDPSWRKLFEEVEKKPAGPRPALSPPSGVDPNLVKNSEEGKRLRLEALIRAYRKQGHLAAKFNPLSKPEKDPIRYQDYNFATSDLNVPYTLHDQKLPLNAIIKKLSTIYEGRIGFEFEDIAEPEVVKFIIDELEKNPIEIGLETKQMIFEYLSKSELFESFMHTKFVGQNDSRLKGAKRSFLC